MEQPSLWGVTIVAPKCLDLTKWRKTILRLVCCRAICVSGVEIIWVYLNRLEIQPILSNKRIELKFINSILAHPVNVYNCHHIRQ